MIIQSLKLSDFRNYENLDINFSEGINILYGDNAQGKTNVLESMFVAATTKSHRGSKDKEMVMLGKEESHIRLGLKKQGINHRIDMHIKKSSAKGAAIDGIRIKRGAELYGMLHIVSFSPEDLTMIKNGPSERRRFMDMELCQLDKIYINCLSKYNKIILQRNNLLKQIPYNNELIQTLEVWNEQLATYGWQIIHTREQFVNEIEKILSEKHRIITDGKEDLKIIYKPNADKENLAAELAESIKKDIEQKTTTKGPHRDDIIFEINGVNARIFGSQGQQRSIALALKLAEIELVKRKINDTPVLLLDDVLSELDRNRQIRLLSEIGGVQTFLTCTGLEEFVETRKEKDSIFHVVSGKVHQI
ncbi:MAG: DNA replication/repair protein RecF [Lachnospiraceae bacterium]